VITYSTLRRSGYTGKIYIVIDDEDSQGPAYRERFRGEVLSFSKAESAAESDEGDNFPGPRGVVVYARNACFRLAESVGCKYFIQLDDDYYNFSFRHSLDVRDGSVTTRLTLDALFAGMVDFLSSTTMLTIAMSQGGDHMGGSKEQFFFRLRRKAMNSFVCSTDRPFSFFGRLNEDVNAYTAMGRRGDLFFTAMQVQLSQVRTQKSSGGLTEAYLDMGTYVKSFYSVMFCPSAVTVGELRDPRDTRAQTGRMHHKINRNACVPKIISERHRK
jgi:hypothetical protein